MRHKIDNMAIRFQQLNHKLAYLINLVYSCKIFQPESVQGELKVLVTFLLATIIQCDENNTKSVKTDLILILRFEYVILHNQLKLNNASFMGLMKTWLPGALTLTK